MHELRDCRAHLVGTNEIGYKIYSIIFNIIYIIYELYDLRPFVANGILPPLSGYTRTDGRTDIADSRIKIQDKREGDGLTITDRDRPNCIFCPVKGSLLCTCG